MADVLFGQSYFMRFDAKLWEAMQPYPPLGTLYAASYVRARGHDVALFDAMLAQSVGEWAVALERERPRIAVIYEDSFNYLSKMCLLRMREAAFAMITMARTRGCIVIVSGSDATDHAERYLDHGAQAVIRGEGEETLVELLDALSGKGAPDLTGIRGLAFRREDGSLVRTPVRPDIRRLDELPFPAWDLVDVDRYREIWMRRHGYYSVNMATTRGCPYHCNWCAKPIWGQRYNSRSPENVVAEMVWLKQEVSPDHIWFTDDIMGLKPGWLRRFADLVAERDARIPYKSLQRADLLLRGDTVGDLARSGAKTVWLGAESGSQKILDAMEKGTRVEQIHEAARRLHEAGIEVGFFVQFGYPGETRVDIRRTMRMVRRAQPDDIGVSVSYPLPGTPFFETVRAQLGAKQNWTDSNDLAMLYRGPFSTAFYRQLHAVLHTRFRARRALAQLRPVARRPWQARGRHLRPAAVLLRAAISLPLRQLRLEWLARERDRGPEVGARPMSAILPK